MTLVDIELRGERSYLFDFEKPVEQTIEAEAVNEVVLIDDFDSNELRALILLKRVWRQIFVPN